MTQKLLFLFLLIFFGCDEFALKKTATIRKVTGTIRFEPAVPRLSFSLVYDMMNYQKATLKEVYFYCHDAITIDRIYDGNTPLRIDQGVGVGMSSKVYRVRVSDWLPGTRRLIRMEGRLTGPEKGKGLFLSREGVFLESKMVWLPISFDEMPAFSYNLVVEVPKGYEVIMGAKLLEEKTSAQSTLSSWESESTNLVFTGRLVIGRLKRVQDEQLALYLPEEIENVSEKRFSTFFSLLREGKDILQRYLGVYPFRDVRIVFLPKEMASLEEWTDGLFSANMLILERSLAFSLTNQRGSYVDGEILSEEDWLYVVKVILHEMSHAYIGYMLRWEEGDILSLESLTEVTSLKLLEWLSPETYRLAMNKLRYDWYVSSLVKKNSIKENSLRLYLYRNLCLASTLSPRVYFRLLRGLLARYRYTVIDEGAILRTLADQGETNTFSFLLSSWNTPLSWAIGIEPTNGGVLVVSTAPRLLPFTLVVETPQTVTHIPLEVEGISFVPLQWRKNTSIFLYSDIRWLDETMGDDVVSEKWQIVVSNLNLYYAGETNVIFTIAESTQDKKLRLPREDRFLSLVAFSSLEIVYHHHEQRENMIFLYAYKKGKNTKGNYALFVFREENNRWYWEGVYDPSLDYRVSF